MRRHIPIGEHALYPIGDELYMLRHVARGLWQLHRWEHVAGYRYLDDYRRQLEAENAMREGR